MSDIIEIKKIAQFAREELAQAIASKKLPNNPASEETFLIRWMAQSLKKQRFHASVSPLIESWVKLGRSRGVQAQLKTTLNHIEAVYSAVFPDGDQHIDLTYNQFEILFEYLKSEAWMVHTEYDINRKVQVYSDGQPSFAICADALKKSLNESGILTRPISVFVRADLQAFVNILYRHGFVAKKITDYKSIVKYHAEFKIFPKNQVVGLMSLPDYQLVEN